MVDVYRRISIQGHSEGFDKVTADLRGVTAAQKEVATASQTTATVTEVSSRKTLSAAAAYDRLRRSIDPVFKAQQQLAASERVLSRAVDQSIIDLQRKNEVLALIVQNSSAKMLAGMGSIGGPRNADLAASERLLKRMGDAGAAAMAKIEQAASNVDPVFARIGESAIANVRLLQGMGDAGAAAMAKLAQGIVAVDPVFALIGSKAIANAKLLQGMGDAGVAALGRIADAQNSSAMMVAGMGAIGGARNTDLAANERLIAGMSGAMDRFGNSARQANYQTKQLSFQLFDIAQGIPLAFASPLYGLMNLATQTGQVSQLYIGQGGLKQAFKETTDIAKGLGAGFLRLGASIGGFLLTPIGAATAAAIALGAAFAAAVGFMISRLPTVDRAIEVQKNAIEGIRAAWKDAEKGSESYRDRALASMQFLANQSKIEQQRLLDFQLRGAANQLSGISVQFGITPTQRALKEFQPDIDKFLASIASGKDDVQSFSAAIDMRADIDPTNIALQNAAKALHEVIDGARDSAQRLKDLRGEFVNLRIDSAFQAASQAPTLADQAARDLEMARRRHGADLFAVGAKSPTGLAQSAALREQATPLSETESPEGRQFRIDSAAALEYARALHAISEAEISRKVARDNAIESANVELSLVGKGIAEQERLTQQTQMLQAAREAARQAGTVVSDEEIAQIKAAAAALGNLNEQIALKQLRSDLSFERSTMFSSDTEQRVAGSMRDIFGDDWKSHMNDADAGVIRMTEHLAEARDLTKDFASTFLTDLQQGKGVIDSLSDALQGLESKLLDMALNQTINGLFGGLFGGGLSAGARGLTGAGLFHQGGIVGQGGAMRYVHPAYFDNAPRLHKGLAPDEYPAILQRGELVTPRGGSQGGAASSMTVHLVNEGTPKEVTSATPTPNGSGGYDLKIFTRDIVKQVGVAYNLKKPSRKMGVAG